MARVASQHNGPAEFLALGDSYTLGEGVEARECWPLQLASLLRMRGIEIADPHIIAKSGWSTDELVDAIDAELAQGLLLPRYGLVSLQIGVNNQYRGRSAEAFATEFRYLLSRAIAFAGGHPAHVLVLSIPDWGSTTFAQASGRNREQIARELDAFNREIADACSARGVTFVDITDLTRQPEHADWLMADGLHPSVAMYALWAERAATGLHSSTRKPPRPDALTR